MPVAYLSGSPAPAPRNPSDPYWKQALTVLKNAVTDPANDFMISNPMAIGGAIVKAAPKVAQVANKGFSMQDEMMRALRGARTAADDVVGVVDDASDVGPRINASGESAASLESLGRRGWEKMTGRQPVRIDRAGRRTPFIGEPGDVRPNPGERIGYMVGDRFDELTRGR